MSLSYYMIDFSVSLFIILYGTFLICEFLNNGTDVFRSRFLYHLKEPKYRNQELFLPFYS